MTDTTDTTDTTDDTDDETHRRGSRCVRADGAGRAEECADGGATPGERIDAEDLLEEAAAPKVDSPYFRPGAGTWSTRSRATRRRSSRTWRPAPRP